MVSARQPNESTLAILHNTLRIATFNMHKGYTHFNARFSLHLQRDMLRKLEADLIFLQEVQDLHSKHRHSLGAKSGQMEFLADSVWYDHCYGKNAVYRNGHHGNAMLSKFPISQTHNLNISAHGSEQRGMLHAEIIVPNWDQPLHTLCVHLGLFAKWRRQQLNAITEYIQDSIPHNAPLILAGDFNDWGRRSGRQFALRLGMHEAFEQHTGQFARSFPSWLPMFHLDRIYLRGFSVKHTMVHAGPQFLKLSDHAVLSATLRKL